MTFKLLSPLKYFVCFVAIFTVVLSTSCNDDDPEPPLRSQSFEYGMHNGQVVAVGPYGGVHAPDVSVTLLLEELRNGKTNITVSIENSMDGETYHVHAHDAADPNTTPNGTPYVESPNGSIFAQAIAGNGNKASATQEADMSFDDLITSYQGFFVVHDPLQNVSTTDLSTFLVLGTFAREQASTNFNSSTYDYAFNTGQVAAAFAYAGTHANNLSASIRVDELADNRSRVVVSIMNTMNGETYHTHAHDVADPATTPNGTPYNEAPNGNVFAAPIAGNGGTSAAAVISAMSHDDIVTMYEGFFVVHDPLQTISTVDPTTYVILGSFAR